MLRGRGWFVCLDVVFFPPLPRRSSYNPLCGARKTFGLHTPHITNIHSLYFAPLNIIFPSPFGKKSAEPLFVEKEIFLIAQLKSRQKFPRGKDKQTVQAEGVKNPLLCVGDDE